MFVKERRSVYRKWVPGIFATIWVILAGFSGAYLYSVITDQSPPTVIAAPSLPARDQRTIDDLAAAKAQLNTSSAQQQKALAEMKAKLSALSEKLASVDTRLRPIEKLLGPVATMPTKTPAPVTTSPPMPAAAPEPEKTAAPKPEPKPAASEKTAKVEKHAKTEMIPPLPSKPPKRAEAASKEEPAPTETASLSTTPPTPAPAKPAEVKPDLQLPPGTTRFGIEIGKAGEASALRPIWHDLSVNHAALVAGLEARRVMAPDKEWRLVAGPFGSAKEATRACALFKKVQLACQPTVFAGDSL